MGFIFRVSFIFLVAFTIIFIYYDIDATSSNTRDILRKTIGVFKFFVLGTVTFFLISLIQTTSYIDVDVPTESISIVGNGDFLVDIDGEHYLIDNDDVSMKSVNSVDEESVTYHIMAYNENAVSKMLKFDDFVSWFHMPNTSDDKTISVSDFNKQYKAVNVSNDTLKDFLK